MTFSKILAVATLAAAVAGVSAPASAYERDRDYNKRVTATDTRTTAVRGTQPNHRNAPVVVTTPRRNDTKVVIVTRDRDDIRVHGPRHRYWDRYSRWHRHADKRHHNRWYRWYR